MEKRMEVIIGGKEYVLVYEEDSAYMEKLANFVNREILEQRREFCGNEVDSTVMAALKIADNYMKTVEELENLKEQVQKGMEEINSLKIEAAELKREMKRYAND